MGGLTRMESQKQLEIIRAWKHHHVFEPKEIAEKDKYYVTQPYPYPTGPLHVGHGRTYTTTDVLTRFARVQGKNVLWPMAFHVTGTPVLAIADQIKRKDPEALQMYRGYIGIYEKNPEKAEQVLHSFVDPKKIVEFFSSVIEKDFDSMGYSIDWRKQFTTMEPYYQQFVQWQFHKFKEKGALVKGKYPILYSAIDGNAVGEDDIKDGDTDKVAITEFQLIKFPLASDAHTFVVVGTLRPDTLYGITNLWMNPQLEYVRAEVNGEKWIVAKNAVEKLKLQQKIIGDVVDVTANDFLEKDVLHPTEKNTRLPILATSFVNAEKGTGIVCSVPGHAPFDFMALEDAKAQGNAIAQRIRPKYIISHANGFEMRKFLDTFKAHTMNDRTQLQQATEEIYKVEFYECRTNSENGPLSNMSVRGAKEKALELLKAVNAWDRIYEPSRKALTRAGNPVCVAILSDQWFLDYTSKEWKEKTHRCLDRMRIFPEKYAKTLHDSIDWLEQRPCIRKRGLGTPFPFLGGWMIEPLSDSTLYMLFYLCIETLRSNGMKPEDLDEAFFDAAILGNPLQKGDARSAAAQEIQGKLQYWYPNDIRHTAPAHIQNHSSFWILAHTLLLPEEWWPRAASFNEMMVRNGQKMSKSKGNIIPLIDAVHKFGPDLMRLYTIASSSLERTADWKDEQVPQVESKLNELEKVLRLGLAFIRQGGAEFQIQLNAETNTPTSVKNASASPQQFWLKEKIMQRLGESYEAYAQMDYKLAAQKAFFEPLNDIKQFKKVFAEDESFAVSLVLKRWLIMICPIAPFLAEQLWKEAGFPGFASAQHLEQPEGKPSKEIQEQVDAVERILGDVEKVRRLAKGNPKTLYIYSVDAQETQWIEAAKAQIEKYALLAVKINDAHDPLGKKAKAQKGKAALYLE